MSGCFDSNGIFTTTAGLRLRCFLEAGSIRRRLLYKAQASLWGFERKFRFWRRTWLLKEN
jgi:hypothetical protein